MTDGNKKVLSLVTLKKLLPPAVRTGYDQKLKIVVAGHGSPTTYATPISDTATGRLPYG